MSTPQVKLTGTRRRNAVVVCPLDKTHHVSRDRAAYTLHMVVSHGANAESFGSTRYAQVGGGGPKDDEKGTQTYPAWPCYGCDSTFSSKADLLEHLLSVHGAS